MLLVFKCPCEQGQKMLTATNYFDVKATLSYTRQFCHWDFEVCPKDGSVTISGIPDYYKIGQIQDFANSVNF